MQTTTVGRLAGQGRAQACAWPELVRRCTPAIPVYPGPAIVPAVTVPGPPMLKHGAALEEHARAVALSYRGGVEKRYRAPCWAFDFRKPLSASKFYGELCLGATALCERAIAPAAWVAFSIDVWRRYVAPAMPPKVQRTPPAVGWVFSPDRIAERADWFAAERVRYEGGQLYVGDAHRDLLRVWQRMQRDLLCHMPTDATAAAAVVRRHFPGRAYAKAVERACDEAEYARTLLQQSLTRGDFLW